jgi:hypothetical protein
MFNIIEVGIMPLEIDPIGISPLVMIFITIWVHFSQHIGLGIGDNEGRVVEK